eukprot:309930_1
MMGNSNCCGCNENPNKQKEILMKQEANINKKQKQKNKTQNNKHKPNNNEDKISKLNFSESSTEFSECKSVKDINTANEISVKQANLAHQNTPITDTKAHAPNHNEDKYMSDEPNKINKCDKNNINDPIKACKPIKR